ncbi:MULTISPECIES: hypothetical protein [Pseudomonas]|jgi:hypothetical protein|uniref:Uncharacterized protein n=1 Tax=Pseudomonas aphyarum TaxID=2942629 RepID=A0ABT5PVF3_9PSED|nr:MULTISPECIES: hypothetical protein [Pseudomonas]MBC8994945.1 hypothetical protein [Pseudomonas sp. N40(2020)]MDD0969695.1 hypothetical protein [Pseudomonas aphyarum]MDD1127775.1 hypothetical protein [Pseudomonas aphyarum]
MTIVTQGTHLHLQSDLEKLGERLIRFGQALKSPDTTVGQLTALASSCGIKLKLRAVAESEARSDG